VTSVRSKLAAAVFASAFLIAAGASADEPARAKLEAAVHADAPTTWRDYLAFASLPDDSAVPSDIQKNAAWLVDAFTRAGLRARILPSGDKPMVYAESANPLPGRKTILFYAHLDGQPVVPAEWHQPSPWIPVLKAKSANGTWAPIPTDRLVSGPVDPQWRLFARAVADDKAPIMMFLAAARAMRAAGVAPSVNVKLLIDSEEEKNSPSLAGVLARNRDLLRADAMIVNDGPMHLSNRPTLIFGNRGIVTATLTVWGPSHAAHSGHYGNFVPNPALRLAALLASMKDDTGRVVIPHYYDGVTIDANARAVMAAVPDDEHALEREFGIAAPERGVGRSLQEDLQYPSLNIRGMQAGQVGAKVATVIPDKAIAELDVRTVPETDPAHLLALVHDWIVHEGWYVIDRAPTDAERATHDKIATWVTEPSGGAAARTALDAPVGRWTRTALRTTFGADPVIIRMMGGTVPTGDMAAQLRIPFVIVPLANADDNQHTHDENLRIGNFSSGVDTFLGLLTTPYPATP